MPYPKGTLKSCLKCSKEIPVEDILVVYYESKFVDLCPECIKTIDKTSLSEIVYSEEPRIKTRLMTNHYLTCPVCHASRVENDFVVLVLDNKDGERGVDGIMICRECFKQQAEFFVDKKPEEIKKAIQNHRDEITEANVCSTLQVSKLERCVDILDQYAPDYQSRHYICQVCQDNLNKSESPYVYVHEVKDGKIVKKSGKVCIECYRRMWLTVVNRVMDKDTYEVVTAVLTKMTIDIEDKSAKIPTK